MKKSPFMVLAVIGLSGLIVVGSTLATIQPIFASSGQETTEDDPQDQSGDGDGSETSEPGPTDEPQAEPEPAPLPAEDTPTLNNEQQQQQEQLTLDIISANGLVLVNDTAGVDGNGGNGNGVGPGTTAREKTCVGNSQGQTFCYEPLPTEQNCLKPINVEDPPLCLPKGD